MRDKHPPGDSHNISAPAGLPRDRPASPVACEADEPFALPRAAERNIERSAPPIVRRRERAYPRRSLYRGVVMLRYTIAAAALVLLCNPATALTNMQKNSVKVGADCIGPLGTLAPKLATCTIAGSKMRIWCPNGDMFEREQDQPHLSLIRSLCNMLQVP